ncbi:MAG: hypothetical protein CL609_11225 [Anaerolineaceae bacterium]|nr:hypothetical protein [Anaerolineaceae bacterium]
MNFNKLKQAEEAFLNRYPGGFDNPEMVEIGKKHKMDKMIGFTHACFEKNNFNQPDLIVDNMIKVVSRSSMVSVFEKPKFRDYVISLSPPSKLLLSQGLDFLLYGNEQQGFEMILDVLKNGKLAKWSLMTICQTYFRPDFDVFIKPTTTKWVIEFLEIDHLKYKPTPTWSFYEQYRSLINEIKSEVDPSLSRYNAAFSGFLMLSMKDY